MRNNNFGISKEFSYLMRSFFMFNTKIFINSKPHKNKTLLSNKMLSEAVIKRFNIISAEVLLTFDPI
jgi:hypothetical protein